MSLNKSPERGETLTLQDRAPAGWHHERPAYAGDPDLDWESRPEPPMEPQWGLGKPVRPSRPEGPGRST